MADNETAERRAKALELHLAGATYDAIAQAVGYASRSGAYQAVQDALAQAHDSPLVSENIKAELARLDAMLTGLWPKARRGDLASVDRVLKIGERRMALLSMSPQAAGADSVESAQAVVERKLRAVQ